MLVVRIAVVAGYMDLREAWIRVIKSRADLSEVITIESQDLTSGLVGFKIMLAFIGTSHGWLVHVLCASML
jgi:hypothetical protein